ncbi:MAG: DsbC family protein [Kistimonas sp.]|nr:DsbC family protein [Kistimonas sp.]
MSGKMGTQLGRFIALATFLVATMAQSGVTHAASEQPDLKSVKARVQDSLQQVNKSLSLESLEATSVTGIFQAMLASGELLYFSGDGKHLFTGDLVALTKTGPMNLTQAFRKNMAHQKLPAVKTAAVFPAEGQRQALVYVFSDVDCGYCKQLHKEIPQLTEKGVEVRYLAFPRGGERAPAWAKMESAWCRKDKKDKIAALDSLMDSKTIASATCDNSPIQSHYDLGRKLGVTGTPSLFLEDGSNIPGYRPVSELLKLIKPQKP